LPVLNSDVCYDDFFNYMNNAISIGKIFKDWSQFVFGSWTNNLNQVVRKGVYNLIEVISNESNK
jgi:hypothetical protein